MVSRHSKSIAPLEIDLDLLEIGEEEPNQMNSSRNNIPKLRANKSIDRLNR